jgi:preprotein translocase subunit SecY
LKFDDILLNLPEVEQPKRKIPFNERIKWTAIVLVIYFMLSMIPVFGLNPAYKARFETLSVLLAAEFGSLNTLGIGPIVTASIILQLLVGADVIKLDMKTPMGKRRFGGLQKLFSIVFIIVENAMYVASGALPPAMPGNPFHISVMIVQLVAGGLLSLFMDEVVSKWGIGSGISLFIVAGVSREIFVNALSPIMGPSGFPIGVLPQVIVLIIQGLPQATLWPLVSFVATIVVFALATYLQAIQVNIPLSFGRVRGFSIKWPLKFIYTSNIPVILTAALLASMQFWGIMMFNFGLPILGAYERQSVSGGGYTDVPVSGLVKYLNPPSIRDIVVNGLTADYSLSLLVFTSFMLIGSILFSVLWIQVGGQDPGTVAGQILDSGLSIPGFRRDKRILERILERYIKPLTVMGGFSVGLLAVIADLFGAMSRGTGILLSVMIVYNFYEQISRQYVDDMEPRLKRFFRRG